jgi:hypothetical protein
MKSSSRCQLRYDIIFTWVTIVIITPYKRTVRETRFAWVGLVMITFTKMWVPSAVNTISICHHDDWKDDVEWTCVCSRITCNPTSLAMEVKIFRLTSCVVMCSPPWTQWNKCIAIKFMAWLHMHRKRPQVVRWGRPNLVHNDEEKMSQAILKDGMIGWVENHICV